MKMLLLSFAFLLSIFSFCNWIIPESLWTWRLSVVTREFGHWFALISICIGAALLRETGSLRWFAVGAALFATVSFSMPLFCLLRMESNIRSHLATRLRHVPPPPFFSWRTLWLGRGDRPISFQRMPYRTFESRSLTLDFYPPQGVGPVAPWVLVVHGGGWENGNSEQLAALNPYLANRGYGVVAMNYRLAPEYQWPAPKEDVEAAVEFVRAHALEWKIDPDRWAILGRSAGGQIAGAVAYGGIARPKSFISIYAPTDLVFGYEVGEEEDLLRSRSLIRRYLGGAPFEKEALYQDASILSHLQEHPVPTLLLHGEPDRLVWIKHSERLDVRLQRLGVSSAFVQLPWGVHGFDYSLNGPGGQVTAAAVEYFLKVTL